MWYDFIEKATYWRNDLIWFLYFRDNKYLRQLQDSKKKTVKLFLVVKERDVLHICLVTFISFISYTKSISFISISLILLIMAPILFSFTLFSYTHITSYFNFMASFIFQPILPLETSSVSRQSFNVKYILYHLKLNSDGISTPCYFKKITTPNLFTPKNIPVNF